MDKTDIEVLRQSLIKTAIDDDHLAEATEQRDLKSGLRDYVRQLNPKNDEEVYNQLLKQYNTPQKLKDLLTSANGKALRTAVDKISQSLVEKPQPVFNYGDEQKQLPIWIHKNKIIETVRSHSVTILTGETGCGKSTQVPQYLYEAGLEPMVCTQPRRIAAITLSHRVGFEMGDDNGPGNVAYQVRYDKTRTPFTRILFATEGVILRHLSVDPMLLKYKVLVLDEVHERKLFTDFLLGMVKVVVERRPKDLYVLLMSATINIDMYRNFFPHAPVITVSGRQHNVETVYRPMRDNGSHPQFDPTPYVQIINEIDAKYPVGQVVGDVLIFLHGADPIEKVTSALIASAACHWIVLPFHGKLQLDEQEKVFESTPAGRRKCVVATNLAETSITINGIKFVIDSGKANVRFYDQKLKMYELRETFISKASADQRRGRAGRTMPGVCYRMYDEHTYALKMLQFEEPEIRRVLPDTLLLQMMSVGIKISCIPKQQQQQRQQPVLSQFLRARTNLYSIDTTFQFLEPPNATDLEEALACLIDFGAVSVVSRAANNNMHGGGGEAVLTSLGRLLAALPLEIQSAKMLTFGALFQGCTVTMRDTCMVAAAALASTNPMFARQQRQQQGRHHQYQQRQQSPKSLLGYALVDEDGDFASLSKIYDRWTSIKAGENIYNDDGEEDDEAVAMERFLLMGRKQTGVQSKSKGWCSEHGLLESYLYDICQNRREYNKAINSTHLFDQFERQRIAIDADGMQVSLLLKKKLRRLLSRIRRRRAYTMAEQKATTEGGGGDARLLNDVRRTIAKSKSPELAAILAARFHLESRNMEEDDEDNDIVKTFEQEWAKFDEQHLEFHLSKLKNVCVKLQPQDEDERKLLQLLVCMALYPNIGFVNVESDANQIITLRQGMTQIGYQSLLFSSPAPVDALDYYDDLRPVKEEANYIVYYKEAVEPNRTARNPNSLPYLRMCGRVAALQALLMCCYEIDIDNTCTRIVFDERFEVILRDVLSEGVSGYFASKTIEDYDPEESELMAPSADIGKRKVEFVARFIRVRKLLNHAVEMVACAALGEQNLAEGVPNSSLSRMQRMTISTNLMSHVKTELYQLMSLMPQIESIKQVNTKKEYSQFNATKYAAHPSLHAEPKNGLVIDGIFSYDSVLPFAELRSYTRVISSKDTDELVNACCIGCEQSFSSAFALFRHCRLCYRPDEGGDAVDELPFMPDDAVKPYRTNPFMQGGNDFGVAYNTIREHAPEF